MNKNMLRTQFSLKASDLADSFRNTVGRMRVGPYDYVPEMTAPEGPSTGGGVQAMQHLRLVSPQQGYPVLVVGHANQRDGTAELRTYENVEAMCRERFKRGAPLDRGQYAQFLESARGYLAAIGLRVTLAGPAALPVQEPPPPAPSRGSGSGIVIGVVAALLGLAIIAVVVVWALVIKR